MKTRPRLSFFIALMIHIALLALVWIVFHPAEEEHPLLHEKRFGVTLSEENDSPKLSEKSAEIPIQTAPSLPPSIHKKTDDTIRNVDKKALSQPDEKKVLNTTLTNYTEADRDTLPRSVLHHYGDEFFALSAGEQHYIIDNLQRIRKINEIVGTRLLRERSDDEIDPDDNNIVEFYLNPDGTISDLHLLKNRLGTPLDELTLQTIDLAHSRYPKPDQKTLIRIRVFIIVK